MKINEIYDELLNVAQQLGITVRKEKGSFKSGFCILNNQEMLVLNRTTPLESLSSVIAKSLSDKIIDNIYIKPVIREYIEKEKKLTPESQDLKIEVLN